MPLSHVTRKLPSFEGVAAGQIASLRLPLGFTYHQIWLDHNFDRAEILSVKIRVNGEVLQELDGDFIYNRNNYDQASMRNNLTLIDFTRRGLLTRPSRELTAIGTGLVNVLGDDNKPLDPKPISNFQLDIELSGNVTNPTLTAYAMQSPARPSGAVLRVRQLTYNPSAAGNFEISDIPKGDLINRIYFKPSVANAVNSVIIKRDNIEIWERDISLNLGFQQTNGRKNPNTDWFVIDFQDMQFGDQPLDTDKAQDLRFILEMSQAATIKTYVEYIGVVNL